MQSDIIYSGGMSTVLCEVGMKVGSRLNIRKNLLFDIEDLCGVSVEWQKFFEKDLPRRPDFFVYGWTQGKSIGDYVILGVSVLRDLYNAGHLNKYIERIKQNTNGLASEFVPIPISELISLPEALGLIAFHSDNHPALS